MTRTVKKVILDEKKLKWKEVGKRLEYLVRMDRYLTDAEREKMPAWINRQTESKPLPPPIPDQKPVCEVGSTVYLENDQRFTVESIGQFDVHLCNEDFPLVGRAVSREQFQQLLDANPRNGGMVLSEQQRESLVQEQREQALSYIEDYLKDEFEITEPDFSDLTQIDLGYTTTEDEQHTIQVNADLEHCTISKFVDDTLYAQDTSSKSHINPMDISEDYGDEGNPIQLKSQFLRDFCQLVLNSKELSAQECSLVDRAALITYQKYLLHPEREQMPSLHDFYNNLSLQGPQAKALTMALSMYVDGTMDLFAHQTNVDLQNHCICFNTVKLGKSMQSIGMMTVLDQIWNRITRNRVLGRRTWIFTDEFQLLLGNSACTNYYFELSSRARKWGAILTSITQHVRSVLNNEDARRMLSDCGYIKLLNQAPDDANDIARLLHISDEEKRYIENAEVGSGLLIADKVVVPFNNTFPQDTELFRLMDTNPNRKK